MVSPAVNRIREKFFSSDLGPVLLLVIWTLFLNGVGLGRLEFIRHTEADRTLIAWEMVERGKYLVPELLSSQILTKPPLYYWSAAALFNLTGSTSEGVARSVSLLASVLMVLTQYLFFRLSSFSRPLSALSALMLSTSLIVFILSTVAEIDMLFGTFCLLGLYFGYYGTHRVALIPILLSYVFCACAFLTKGPPIIFFYSAGVGLFILLHGLSRDVSCPKTFFVKTIIFHLIGVLVFSGILLAWLIPLANHVGWETLRTQFEVEVLSRVLERSDRGRGPLFYAGSVISGLVPWSVFLLAGGFNLFFPWGDRATKPLWKFAGPLSAREHRPLFVFSVLMLLTGVFMLSLSEGKSSRYCFPVIPFGLNLCVFALGGISRSRVEEWFFFLGKLMGIVVIPVCVALFVLMKLEGVSDFQLGISALALAVSVLSLGFAAWRRNGVLSLLMIAFIMLSVRIGQIYLYVPHRNATRTVKPIAEAINLILPEGETLYSVEMFERWVSYYLKHLGRNTIRISPEQVHLLTQEDEDIFILLDADEEAWRIRQLAFYDPELALVKDFREFGSPSLFLIRTRTSVLPYLQPKLLFPTAPSIPFYPELAQHGFTPGLNPEKD